MRVRGRAVELEMHVTREAVSQDGAVAPIRSVNTHDGTTADCHW